MNERDRQVSALWCEVEHPAPPAALDAAVLAAVHAAAPDLPRAAVGRRPLWWRWQAGFALAAVAVLSSSLSWLVHDAQQASEAPAAASAARPAPGTSAPRSLAPAAADAEALGAAPPSPATAQRAHEHGARPGGDPAKSGSSGTRPTIVAAPAASRATVEPSPAEPPRSTPTGSPAPAAAGGAGAVHLPAATAPPVAAPLSAAPSAAPAERVSETPSLHEGSRPAVATADSAVGDDSADDLIRRIRAARAQDQLAEVQRLLALLRHRYPDRELPADLREPTR
ncbi:hypothetical protein [Accumulibacter sp.]|uniref:hypothetical protein n=1 Tax=Accumulibacter sp. TaxID=2053492 RepID=UPI002CB39F71|nr:hypothetical protein [Accumulibacter sp.]HNE40377.1 hypothetical protein [Accumulibacter sp.]